MSQKQKINNSYIGVFDSGVGGLTVLEDLSKNYPHENFLYFGDTLRCPYGTKEQDEIKRIVISDIEFLKKHNVKAIVIACNTATSVSYDIKCDIPIIRIIEPTCEIVKNEAKKMNVGLDKVCVLATNYTCNSHAYNRFLDGLAKEVKCSSWVSIIEAGKTDSLEADLDVKEKLKDTNCDIYILGCTHFGLLENKIKKYAPNKLIINSSLCLKAKLKEVLDEVGYSDKRESVKICISGDIDTLNYQWFRNSDGSGLNKEDFIKVNI